MGAVQRGNAGLSGAIGSKHGLRRLSLSLPLRLLLIHARRFHGRSVRAGTRETGGERARFLLTKSHENSSTQTIHRHRPEKPPLHALTSVTCLFVVGFVVLGTAYAAVFNHPPTISFLVDQRISSGKFAKQYIRIFDNEQTLTAANISVVSTNTSFTNPIGITWGACGPDDIPKGCPSSGGYYIDFPFAPGTSLDPSATVKVKVTDSATPALDATSSFTLRKDSAINPPVVAGIPNETIRGASGIQYDPVWFVVGDLDSSGKDDVADPAGNSKLTSRCPPTTSISCPFLALPLRQPEAWEAVPTP